MKKLISALTIRQAKKDGVQEIIIESGKTIVTPEARSMAKDFGIALMDSGVTGSHGNQSELPGKLDEKLVRQVVEQVVEKLPPDKRQPELVREVVVEVLSEYLNGREYRNKR